MIRGFMHKLSIGKAWDDCKERVARDGRPLFWLVAALVGLPSLVMMLVWPEQAGSDAAPVSTGQVAFGFATLVAASIATLSVAAIALLDRLSVAEAVRRAVRVFPNILGAALLLIVPFLGALVAALFIGGNARLLGQPFEPKLIEQLSLTSLLLILLTLIMITYFGIRMMLSTQVAIVEGKGPVALLKRSWELTTGHFLRLLGFALLVGIAQSVAEGAASTIFGLAGKFLLGPVEPFSLSALLVGIVVSAITVVFVMITGLMSASIYSQLSTSDKA